MSKGSFVAFIPVRGGSKGIPGKNIRKFCGQPLVYWAVKVASDSKRIDKVYVSTDSKEIKSIVEGFKLSKVQVIGRSKAVSTDTASTEAVMLEFAKKNNFENIVLIQATSPLLEARDLDKAIEKFEKGKFDSLLSLVKQKRFLWKTDGRVVEPINYDYSNRPRRQDFDGFLVENGAFYITSKDLLMKSKCRLSGKIGSYEMKEDSYYEIDTLNDWIVAEKLKFERIKADVDGLYNLNNVKLLVCDMDGVMTDAGMYYSKDGERMKKFSARDGMGIKFLRNNGIKIILLTGEDNQIVRERAKKLNVDFLGAGVKDKLTYLKGFFEKNKKYNFKNTAYIGDDLNDLECLSRVYFSACPADAVAEVKGVVKYLCVNDGGGGCVREVCDLIINNR